MFYFCNILGGHLYNVFFFLNVTSLLVLVRSEDIQKQRFHNLCKIIKLIVPLMCTYKIVNIYKTRCFEHSEVTAGLVIA